MHNPYATDGIGWGGVAVKGTDPDCLALASEGMFFIKVLAAGPRKGAIYDPVNDEGVRRTYAGEKTVDWARVSEKVYDSYVRYVRGGPLASLRAAEREMKWPS